MLNLKEILPEHQALIQLVIGKINDLYQLQQLFSDSEDKFLAGWALKNAALYMNSLVINGTIRSFETGLPCRPPTPLNEMGESSAQNEAAAMTDQPLDAA